MTALAAALRLGLAHWKLVLSVTAVLTLGLMLISAKAESRHWHDEAERFALLYRAEQEAHRRTIADYRRAAELARAKDQANAARVERDQSIISKEVSNDYQARLAGLRARYDALRLRRGAATARSDPGAGGAAHLPQTPASARGAAQATGEEGLPPDAAELDWRLICSSQAEQLDALIDWVERQKAVAASAEVEPLQD
jgi:hypothetical protein